MNNLNIISRTSNHDHLEASRLRQQAVTADAALAALLKAEADDLDADARRLERMTAGCKRRPH